jgi:hypothetical protein
MNDGGFRPSPHVQCDAAALPLRADGANHQVDTIHSFAE